MEKALDENSSEQVHIISAGGSINETFNTVTKKYNINTIIVFKEIGTEAESDKDVIDEINNAISTMKKSAQDRGVTFVVEEVRVNDINDVRDKVFSIARKYGKKRLYFNLTHGRKLLPLFLLTMAVWVDGIPYYIEKGRQTVNEISIPRMHALEVLSNSNFFTMLQILHEKYASREPWTRYKDAYAKISDKYESWRSGRSKKLSMGTYSKWIGKLVEFKFVEVRFEVGNNKQKELRLTDDGAFAYMLYRVKVP